MDGNDRRILSVTMLGHGTVHAYELAIPIFIPLWMAEFDESAAIIGIVVAIGYALYGFGAVPSGVVTDEYGSMRLMSLSLFGMGAAFLILSFASSAIGVAVALIVWGIAASIYHPSGLRLISTGVHERGTAFGYHGIAGNAGIALGPFLATVFLIGFEWRAVVALLAIPALIGAVYTYSVSVDELAAVSSEAASRMDTRVGASIGEFLGSTRVLFSGGFIVVLPMVVLEGFYYRGVLTFLPDVLAGYPALAQISIGDVTADPSRYVFVGILVIGMAGQYIGGRLSDRMPPERAAIGAFVLLGLLSVIFVPAASAGLVPLLIVSGLLGLVLFGEQPLLQAIVADYSGSAVRGLSYGYMFLGVFGIGALGAAVSGAVLAYSTAQALFLLLGVIPILAAFMAAALVAYGDELPMVVRQAR